ncbi:MAG: hypothetical protein R3C01_09685 [Planctomycetaceae bacterium]
MSEGRPEADQVTPAATTKLTSEKEPRGSRLATIMGGVLLLGCLLICGVCTAGFFLFRPQIHPDPERVEPVVAEMLRISVPPEFEPRGIIEWPFFHLMVIRGAYFELTGDDGILMLVQVDSGLLKEEDISEHVRQTLREEGASGPPLTITATESREFVVRGRPVTFQFQLGEDPETELKYHLVEGVVDGNSGPVLIAFRVTDDSWLMNEAKVINTINSVQ